MKFQIKDLEWGGYRLYGKSWKDLIMVGDIKLYKENRKSESWCEQNQSEHYFNYHGIQNALCGKQPNTRGIMYFTPKRIQVIQME